jgi:hypothetical protein
MILTASLQARCTDSNGRLQEATKWADAGCRPGSSLDQRKIFIRALRFAALITHNQGYTNGQISTGCEAYEQQSHKTSSQETLESGLGCVAFN